MHAAENILVFCKCPKTPTTICGDGTLAEHGHPPTSQEKIHAMRESIKKKKTLHDAMTNLKTRRLGRAILHEQCYMDRLLA